MTRKEQIKQAWLHGDAEQLTSFRLGAEWADEHPQNPWISVEDRLPEEFEMVFVHMQGGAFDCAIYTNGVFEHDLQVKFGFKDSGYSIISWQQKFKSNITHWMPIPELKKGE